MTDLDKFTAFFEELGVIYELEAIAEPAWPPDDVYVQRLPTGAATFVSVAQALFTFDADGRYIGTLSDETLAWEPRRSGDRPLP